MNFVEEEIHRGMNVRNRLECFAILLLFLVVRRLRADSLRDCVKLKFICFSKQFLLHEALTLVALPRRLLQNVANALEACREGREVLGVTYRFNCRNSIDGIS